MARGRAAGGHGRALRVRLRIAAFIALAAGLLFFAIQSYAGPATGFPPLVFGWVAHTALATVALVASYSALTARHLDRVIILLVGAHVANTHLYLMLAPQDPILVASGLTTLFVVCAVFFSWSARRLLVTSVVTSVAFVLVGARLAAGAVSARQVAVAFGVLLVGASIAVASGRVLGRLRASLARRQRELALLSARLMSVQEEERRRLSRELHDEFGQSLTAVNAYLWLIERQPADDPAALRLRVTEARRVVTKTLAAMRELSQLLRPSVLDDFGLVPSLDTHLKGFAERHEIETSFTADGLPERLPAEMETALYRIAQEALTNVARHARARHVRIALAVQDGELRLDIEDDGVGFPSREVHGGRVGTGLVGIRERVRALGGVVTLHSTKGARLRVTVPLPK